MPPQERDDDPSARETQRIEAMVAEAREIFPEFSHALRSLIDAGMATGWRDLAYIGPLRPDPPGTIALSQMVIGGLVPTVVTAEDENPAPKSAYGAARYK